MKVRIGFGPGTAVAPTAAEFADMVDALEGLGFDSLWLSERLTADTPDPLIGLAVAAGRTRRLKLGTSVLVLPGRNPVLVAAQLATLDVLSAGRLLPAFGLGAVEPAEHRAFGVVRGERAGWFDEALPLIRRLWLEEVVDHDGPRFRLEGVTVGPKPLQKPPDVWLGGRAPSELRRVGRLGDGWLPSFCTPAEAGAGREQVEAAAAAAGRTIDPEHFGALVVYSPGPLPERLRALLAARRPDTDPADVVPVGVDGLRRRLEEFVDHGISKLVPAPVGLTGGWEAELRRLADGVLDLQGTR